MRVCGVELKGGEAIISLLSYEGETFNVPECRKVSFSVSQSSTTEAIRDFHFAFHKLMQDYKVDEVVIIEREQKGKLAGSATSFKLEAAIQLGDIPVHLLSPVTIKEQNKRNPPQVDFDSLDLKRVQQAAFEAAYAQQNRHIFGKV
ncbi:MULTISPECIES: DUF3010 family protein [Shewanella]|jgi:hypothetical protein|uniref:DUF3010 family protein n=3 Tax=Shewanella putrefaciens TaxID=24 RepID=E6XGH8_SHEP2|nr:MULTISPECIES: DUF3010 family protein [Shewanella]CAD6365250.1 hypothetical protein SHEWT2_00410 [Shewanella hafniensis]ABM25387.1 conserved hypothetical protein [Shewanella sp. W3-18-1]AVV82824.1 hypothetical protein SPWS13_1013 [Shewanella putrefaciens]MCA1896004.1 DUF3010 family protein [Shewanella putrefaciens]MCK7629817.1 DUF3010 family protein [Shewanella sp. JNE9-1]